MSMQTGPIQYVPQAEAGPPSHFDLEVMEVKETLQGARNALDDIQSKITFLENKRESYVHLLDETGKNLEQLRIEMRSIAAGPASKDANTMNPARRS